MKKISFFLMLFASIFVSQQVKALTYTVVVPEGTNTCYITGDAAGGWGTWVKMTKTDATHYTVDLPNATETAEYKYYSGPDWSYEEAIDVAGTSRESNRKYSDNNGVDNVLFWKAVFTPELKNLTLDCFVPSTVHELYITGNFNGWSGVFGDSQKMTYVGEESGGKVFTFALTTENPGGLEFKFIAGPDWAYEQTASANFKLSDGNNYETDKYAYNVQSFKSIFDPALAGYITITATVPATGDVWIQGSLFGWNWDNPSAHLMTKNTNGTYSYTTSRPIQTMEYRLYNGADWANPEQEYDETTQAWKEKSNRAVNFVTDGANISITVCKWTNGDGGTLCGPNALNDVNADYFTIISNDNKILVNNALNRVEIYNLTGKNIESRDIQGNFTSKTLSKGLYLVRVDGFARKMLVK